MVCCTSWFLFTVQFLNPGLWGWCCGVPCSLCVGCEAQRSVRGWMDRSLLPPRAQFERRRRVGSCPFKNRPTSSQTWHFIIIHVHVGARGASRAYRKSEPSSTTNPRPSSFFFVSPGEKQIYPTRARAPSAPAGLFQKGFDGVRVCVGAVARLLQCSEREPTTPSLLFLRISGCKHATNYNTSRRGHTHTKIISGLN